MRESLMIKVNELLKFTIVCFSKANNNHVKIQHINSNLNVNEWKF